MDILTIGEVLIDLTQTGKDARGIPQFAANPGGAPANLAVAASRLGAQTAFIGRVYLGVVQNAPHPERAAAYIHYLFQR